MPDTKTTYLGIQLKNPVIISSSGLTGSLEGVKKAADAGAGGVVLKSLFEEQISADLDSENQGADLYNHPEAADYLGQMGMQLGPRDYLSLISQAKAQTDMPVLASVNCVGQKWWTEYAKQLNESGADGLELNIGLLPRNEDETSQNIEDYIVHTIDVIARNLSIPFSVKLGPYFTALPNLARRIRERGAKGLVLFNRFYQFDIDTETESAKAGILYSSPSEYASVLRWISILSGRCGMDLCATTGISDSQGIIKMLLAGASAVQVASVVYKEGFSVIATMVEGLEAWMKAKGYASILDFRASVSQEQSQTPEVFERLQYIKALTGYS